MKVIIAGSRTIDNFSPYELKEILDRHTAYTEIVSGGARGMDTCGERFAKYFKINLTLFKADWGKFGKGAGPIRNKQMADYSDALLLIWDGSSKGSANMKATMLKLNKPVYEIIIKGDNDVQL